MNRLMWILHAVISTTLMGIGVTGVLAANMAGWKPIVIAAAIGFIVALPVSWFVANKIQHLAR